MHASATYLLARADTDLPIRLEESLDALVGYGWEDLAWTALVVAVAWIAGRLAANLLLRLVERWTKGTESVVDDIVLGKVRKPLAWLGPIVVVRFAIPLASVPDSFAAPCQHTLLIAAIAAGAWLAHAIVRSVEAGIQAKLDLGGTDNLRARELATSTRGVRNIADFVILILSAGFILMTFESVRQIGSTLLASAGVAGLVIGFAAQKSISTVLAGIQIAITQPIRVDDVVIVENEWGRIEEITLTYVVVRIWDLRRLVVPISYFIDKPFQNWTRASAELLGTVDLHLDYGVPVDEIRGELKRILDASEKWDKKVWSVQVTAASERAMTVRPLFSAKNASDQWDLRCEVREKLIAFIQKRYPEALPRLRAELTGAQPTATSSNGRRAGDALS